MEFSIFEDSENPVSGVTLNHEYLIILSQGFLTFALCPHNDIQSSPEPECFHQHRLLVLDNQRGGGYKHYALTGDLLPYEGDKDKPFVAKFEEKLLRFTVRIGLVSLIQ